MEKVPKQYSLEIGYRHISSSNFENKASMGYYAMFDYAWKLSGFIKKHSVYLSVPIGYSSFMANDTKTDKDMSVLSYGWTVRHELTKNKKFTPFLGYALLLNQLRVDGTDGSNMGHQTRFELGTNLKTNSRFIPYISAEYSITRHPEFGKKESTKFNTFGIKLGVRI